MNSLDAVLGDPLKVFDYVNAQVFEGFPEEDFREVIDEARSRLFHAQLDMQYPMLGRYILDLPLVILARGREIGNHVFPLLDNVYEQLFTFALEKMRRKANGS